MLTYLDALLDALALRDAAEVTRLLAHPLARILPEAAQAEARAIADGSSDPLAAPLHVLQLRHMTAELLRQDPEVADRVTTPVRGVADAEPLADARQPRARDEAFVPPPRRSARLVQMELPLSA